MAHEIKVERREDAGKGASRRLRHTDKVPAIVYGGGLDPVSIELDHNDVFLAQQNEWFYSTILNLSLNGDVQQVLLQDIQRHPAKPRILHLDFLRVMPDQPITVTVPLHFINQAASPAGKSSLVNVTHELNSVEITCLPAQLPESINVDLIGLESGHVVHLSNIALPEGVSIPSLRYGPLHDLAVVVARPIKIKEETVVAAPAKKGKK